MNTKPNEELREQIYDKLKSDKQADTYVIPTRVMDTIVEFIQTEMAEAKRRAVLKELKAIWNETQHDILPVGLEPVEYTASVVLRRIKELTEIEVSGGED